MKFSLKTISTVLAFIISLSAIVSLIFSLDNRWAKADEVKKIEYRLEQKIQQDRVDALQQRMWKLEDRFEGINNMPQEVKDEYRKLEKEKIILEKFIENIIEKTKK